MKKPESGTTGFGYFLIICGAVLWGTTGTTQGLAPSEATPEAIGALRLLVGGLTLLIIAFIKQKTIPSGIWSNKYLWLSALFTAIYQLCFFAGVKQAGVAIGTVVGIGSAPIAGGILGYLFRKEILTRKWFWATALATTGLCLLALSGDQVNLNLTGLSLAIGAGVAYAAFTLTMKNLLESYPPLFATALAFCIGSLGLFPFILLSDYHWIFTPQGLIATGYMGIVATALAYLFFTAGLRTVKVSSAVTLTLAEPLTASILGVLILQETLNIKELTGIFLLFTGITLLSVKLPRRFRVS